MLPAFVILFTAILAETKRAPFDLPESESELVAGFMTEYSGIRWSFFFFGGFESPLTHFLPEGSVAHQLAAFLTITVKSFAGIFLMMWVRWTLPRVRIDQVMTLGYKYLTPLALLCVLGAGVWEALIAPLWRS